VYVRQPRRGSSKPTTPGDSYVSESPPMTAHADERTSACWDRGMPDNDGGPPPKHFGDCPNGSYWTAEGPTGSAEDDALDFTVEGNSIKFMWDYGVVVPLWDGNGLVPQEPKWLHNALGLSDALIRDLRDW